MMPFQENQDYYESKNMDSSNLSEIIYQNQDEYIYENSASYNYTKSDYLAPNKCAPSPRKTNFSNKMANISENSKLSEDAAETQSSASSSKISKEKASKKDKTASTKIKNAASITIGIRNIEISSEVSEKILKSFTEPPPPPVNANTNTLLNTTYSSVAKESDRKPPPFKIENDAMRRMNDLIDTKSQMDDNDTNYESKSNLNVDLDSDEENNGYLIDDIFSKPGDTRRATTDPSHLSRTQSVLKKENAPCNLNGGTVQGAEANAVVDDNKKSKKFRGLAKSFKWINRKNVKNLERQDSIDELCSQSK